MQQNSWSEERPYDSLDPLNTLLSDLPTTEDVSQPEDTLGQRRFAGRRGKAAVVLTMVWGGTIALHLSSWGIWLILALTTVMGIHALRILLARPLAMPAPLASDRQAEWPFVSLLVAAKNEEAVIASLVKMLCSIDYPSNRYEVWVIDDGSTDRTPEILQELAGQYPQLRALSRPSGSMGGKSGALNAVLPATQGEFIVVFDADATVPPDLLRRVLPVFDRPEVGAVQTRKAIAQTDPMLNPAGTGNFWLWGQRAEMAMDSFFQQQRIAIGGIGELRGNGQFVRRRALMDCGGWNEETITDDLDMTLRLHLYKWDVQFVLYPAVVEEGVTTAKALWHQRNRWAEGGYQRYLDYWDLLVRNRLGVGKSLDLLMFLLTQYIMPTAAIPDLLMAIVRNRPLLLSPIASLTIALSLIGMFVGLRRTRQPQLLQPATPSLGEREQMQRQERSPIATLLQTLQGTVYMLHWIVVMSSVTARMSIRPKRLKWVKTAHRGVSH